MAVKQLHSRSQKLGAKVAWWYKPLYTWDSIYYEVNLYVSYVLSVQIPPLFKINCIHLIDYYQSHHVYGLFFSFRWLNFSQTKYIDGKIMWYHVGIIWGHYSSTVRNHFFEIFLTTLHRFPLTSGFSVGIFVRNNLSYRMN